MALGILVIGSNHFIVDGPEPNAAQALALARQWSIIQIGNNVPEIPGWSIRNKAFREDLEWAVVIEQSEAHSPAVQLLLQELESRKVRAKSYKSMGSAETGML